MSSKLSLVLFVELERRLSEIEPEEYIPPDIVGLPGGSKELGPATEEMKRLWTLWSTLKKDPRLGETELLKRAVHVAISFEIGKHFNHWRARAGINSDWQVYAVTSQ